MNSRTKKEPTPKYCKNKKCENCGTKQYVQHVPHLYDCEINGNCDRVYICDDCNYQAGQDI